MGRTRVSWRSRRWRAKVPLAVVVDLRLGQRLQVQAFKWFISRQSANELPLWFDDPAHEHCATRVPPGWNQLKTHVMSRYLIGNITWELQGTNADTLVIRESIECRGCVPSLELLCRPVIALTSLTLSAKNNGAAAEGPLKIFLERPSLLFWNWIL